MSVTANFFWHGPGLRLYERACLTSFVRAGLTVHLYTFDNGLAVPDGVERRDAALFAREDEVFSFTQGGKRPSIAAFTDVFRYRLFKQEPGWWFDTDVYCLSSVDAFKALEARSKGLLVGEQAPGKLNGAVLFIADPAIAIELEAQAREKGTSFPWGAIGPALITEYVRKAPERCTVVPPEIFYPVHYQEADMLLRAADKTECERRGQNAVALHLWNEILNTWNIPVEFMPSRGSYLSDLFLKSGVTVDPAAALPEATMEELQYFGRIGPRGRWFVHVINQLRAVKQRLVDARL